MSSAIFRGIVLAFGAALVQSACLSATEIRLHVHTNVPCTDPTQWKGVAVYAGAPDASLETKAPVLTSTECDASGQVGTLVIVPSGSKDEQVGLRIVGGIGRAPEDCAAHAYQGCIVARRSVRFSPHDTLDLDVALTAECVGQGCDATHTCVAGTCSTTESVAALPQPEPDAGLPSDAPKVHCGDVFCPTHGNVCCLTVNREAGTATGTCKESASCLAPSFVLNCDDETDCTELDDASGRPGVCALSYNGGTGAADEFTPGDVFLSQCLSYQAAMDRYHHSLELCENQLPCGKDKRYPCDGTFGLPTNPLPGYHTCHVWEVQP